LNDEIKEITNNSKNLVIEYAKRNNKNMKMIKYEAVKCKTQTVAGINYFIKICINDNQYIHVFIWRKLDKSVELLKVDFDKTESDPLIFIRSNNNDNDEQKQEKPVRRLGGLKDREIDDLVIKSCKRIRNDVVSKAKNDQKDSKFTEFTPIKVKSQVVAGTNLFVKVKVNSNQFIHIRIWCKLDSSIELTNVEWNKNENDDIVYF